MLTEIQILNEIRDIQDLEYEEIIDGDGKKLSFTLKKRPFILEVSIIPSCLEPDCKDPTHNHGKTLEVDKDYSLEYKSHKIIFKSPPELGNKIKLKWIKPVGEKEPFFLKLSGNEDIKDAVKKHYGIDPDLWDTRGFEFKWHQIVRLAIDAEKARYMYEKFLSLLLTHRRNYKEYFKLKSETGVFFEPNYWSRINKISNLGNLLFEIYGKILKKTNFEYPKKNLYGQILRGNVNWQKTIKNSHTIFPINFHSTIPFRNFDTPENFLIIYCLHWLYRDIKEILEKYPIELNDPKEKFVKNSLLQICNKSEMLLKKFPFPKTLENSKQFWSLKYDDMKINQLIHETELRLKRGLIKNHEYENVLKWINLFKELDLSYATEEDHMTNYPLSSIKSYDSIYEAWIFFSFFDYLKRKHYRPYLKISHNESDNFNAYFQIFIDDQPVTFFYEKKYSETLVATQNPDFTVEFKEKILCIFDAKNFSSTEGINKNQLKMLGYMLNSNSTIGGLIFPWYPKKISESGKDTRKKRIRNYILQNYPHIDENKNQKEFNKLKDTINQNIPDILNIENIPKQHIPDENSYFKDCMYMDIRIEPDKDSENQNELVLDKLMKIIIEQVK